MGRGRQFTPGSPYLASRVDENQSDIVSAFRKLGYSVSCLHGVGNGVFDLLISKHGITFSVEVKDGSKSFTGRQFTKAQRKWNFAWQGMKCVAKCLDDVTSIDTQFRAIASQIKAAGIILQLDGCQDTIYQPSLY